MAMSILLKRTISSIVLIGIVVGAIVNQVVLGLVTMLFIILGLYEYFTMLERKGIYAYKYFGIIMGAIIPLSIMVRFQSTKNWEFLFIIIALFSLIMMQFKRRLSRGVIVSISTTIFGILYISWFLSFLIKIRWLPNGLGLLVVLLASTKIGDIGAYLIGSRFGTLPLMPKISPKKTVEGAIGGLLFSVLGAMACAWFVPYGYVHLAFIGLILGVLGQLGDLSESLLKRDCQIKDSGNLIPGMGGMLDELDSLIFAAPVFYFYISSVVH